MLEERVMLLEKRVEVLREVMNKIVGSIEEIFEMMGKGQERSQETIDLLKVSCTCGGENEICGHLWPCVAFCGLSCGLLWP
jgi:hypothetical protein